VGLTDHWRGVFEMLFDIRNNATAGIARKRDKHESRGQFACPCSRPKTAKSVSMEPVRRPRLVGDEVSYTSVSPSNFRYMRAIAPGRQWTGNYGTWLGQILVCYLLYAIS
jgi:hypothetical protein